LEKSIKTKKNEDFEMLGPPKGFSLGVYSSEK
jgi:hypothetical protein